jgi:hypothetical protein
LVKNLGPADARRINLFHNYVVSYWCRHIGPDSFSVFGAEHTTNNRLERQVVILAPLIINMLLNGVCYSDYHQIMYGC